jgi:DNA (cytosine-5)-methyltransferase 1
VSGRPRILDLFAGPGGWDQGLATLGHHGVLGIEWDKAACDTALAAGHARLWADVAALPVEAVTAAYGPFDALIASPPCQAWSMAGKRAGELDRANCHTLADRMAAGDDSTDWTEWEDERSPLVCQPVRWARELRPRAIVLEEVPAVASLWEHFARIFRGWGYSVWTGDLNAADYGVPQTRTRRILIARRDGITAAPPAPTHTAHPHIGADLFGGELSPWVTMAQALGWSEGLEVNTRGDRQTPGGNEFSADRPSWALTEKTRSWFVAAGVTGEGRPKDPATQPADTLTGKGTAYWLRMGNQEKSAIRSVEEPAPTVLFGARSNKVEWFYDRPATTVVGSFKPEIISPPGYRTDVSRQNAEGGVRVTVAEGGVRVTVAEGGVLQSFPPDYPWQGSRTKQYQQVGNAVPPQLAAHVLSTVLDVTLRSAA